MIIDRELDLAVHIPRAFRCSNPHCTLATRCPGEPCKKCQFEQEQMRIRWRLLRAGKERAI